MRRKNFRSIMFCPIFMMQDPTAIIHSEEFDIKHVQKKGIVGDSLSLQQMQEVIKKSHSKGNLVINLPSLLSNEVQKAVGNKSNRYQNDVTYDEENILNTPSGQQLMTDENEFFPRSKISKKLPVVQSMVLPSKQEQKLRESQNVISKEKNSMVQLSLVGRLAEKFNGIRSSVFITKKSVEAKEAYNLVNNPLENTSPGQIENTAEDEIEMAEMPQHSAGIDITVEAQNSKNEEDDYSMEKQRDISQLNTSVERKKENRKTYGFSTISFCSKKIIQSFFKQFKAIGESADRPVINIESVIPYCVTSKEEASFYKNIHLPIKGNCNISLSDDEENSSYSNENNDDSMQDSSSEEEKKDDEIDIDESSAI